MKYILSILALLLCSTSAYAYTPSDELTSLLDTKITELEILIIRQWKPFREKVISALDTISKQVSTDKATYIVNYLLTWIQKNAKKMLTREDFAESYDWFEIVQLPDQILAIVRNEWPLGQNNDDAFEYLSSYIFGNNSDRAEIAMTSPVMRMPLDTSSYETAFIMPGQWTMQTLPQPNTNRITLKQVPGSLKAVKRFSGWTSESVVDAQRAEFQEQLSEVGIVRYGLPTLSLYDGPWVPASRRRNELWVELNASE